MGQVSEALRMALIAAASAQDQAVIDAPVFALYGVSPSEAAPVRRIADTAQVTVQRRKARAFNLRCYPVISMRG